MRNKLPVIARLGLGFLFAFAGFTGLFGVGPQPAYTGDAALFLGGLATGGWFFPLLKATELLVGLALLSNRFVPLALVVLAPVTLNIVGFHAFLAPAGLAVPVVAVAVHAYLGWVHRAAYAPLFAAQPAARVTRREPAIAGAVRAA